MKESIFDGWTKKVEHRTTDMKGGFCAAAYLAYVKRFTVPQMQKTGDRIGGWIQKNYETPEAYKDSAGFMLHPSTIKRDAFVWANNECILDIDGFKRADLQSRPKRRPKVTERSGG